MAVKKPHKKSRANAAQVHGEDLLGELEAIRIRLENGQEYQFNRKEELSAPDGRLETLRAAREAPGRYAFWSYQTDRALNAVRRLEVDLSRLEGETYLVYRKFFKEDTDEDYVSDHMIRSRVAMDKTVLTAKVKLNRARKQYNLLRSMRVALEHRCYFLRRLIALDADEATES